MHIYIYIMYRDIILYNIIWVAKIAISIWLTEAR